MVAKLRLRRLVYLDEDLLDQFSAQVVGGIYSDERQEEESSSGRGLAGGVKGGPVHAEGSRGSSDVERVSRTVRQVADGTFARLVRTLEEEEAIQWLEAVDDEIWGQLRRGEVVEAETNLVVPTIFELTGLMQSMATVMEAVGEEGTTDQRELEETTKMANAIDGLFQRPTVIAELAGTPRYKFIVPIQRSALRVEFSDLAGEFTVLGTIERKVAADETWSLVDALGLGALPRATRREMERDLRAMKDMAGNIVRGPAAILAPLAIHR